MKIPVMVRMVTRLAHSRAVVVTEEEPSAENALSYPANPRQWVLMPGNSRVRYRQLLDDYAAMEKEAEVSPFNKFTPGSDRRTGILASGIAANYVDECFPAGSPFPVLKISQYPLPKVLVEKLADSCDEILVVEEGQPVIERSLRGLLDRGVKVRGKLDGILPLTGELTPDSVAAGLAKLHPDLRGELIAEAAAPSEMVVPRPPALCQGCGHRDVYAALNMALADFENAKVFGDIGCYTLGWLAPFNAIDTCVDMGASITMAKGAADAGQRPAVAIIGDSTFTHSGMTGLLDAVNENTPMTVIISDNLTTGMTGGQDSQGTGKLEEICIGLGVDPAHLHTIDAHPRKVEEMKELFAREFAFEGLSVIVSRRECIQTARRHARSKK
ncbi:MAG: indolepyruvate ferredoxin oxidoreductase, partial [Duncaniella sp.]|nr:indolepyruvate ferredoxin oxidoreductase [Duncaniella sp.]